MADKYNNRGHPAQPIEQIESLFAPVTGFSNFHKNSYN